MLNIFALSTATGLSGESTTTSKFLLSIQFKSVELLFIQLIFKNFLIKILVKIYE